MDLEPFLILPASGMFISSGISKLRRERPFRYHLIQLGLLRLAHRKVVHLVGVMELVAGTLGLALTPVIGPVAAVPMAIALVGLTGGLLLLRPSDCGCGPISLGWRLASIRNVALLLCLVGTAAR